MGGYTEADGRVASARRLSGIGPSGNLFLIRGSILRLGRDRQRRSGRFSPNRGPLAIRDMSRYLRSVQIAVDLKRHGGDKPEGSQAA
jgi:hypothetical protein